MWVTQMFAPKWPWVAGHRKGKEKMKPNDWRGTPNGSGVPFPSAEVNPKKGSFLSNARGRRTIAILLRAKDKKTETRRTPSPPSQYTKNRTKSISPWKKKNSPVEPRQKNKISNFGTFSLLHPNFVYLSLSIWKRRKAKKRHLYSWTIL